MMSELRIHP